MLIHALAALLFAENAPAPEVALWRLDCGPVLLSGDQYHTRAGYAAGALPGNNDLPDGVLRSGARFRTVAAERRARVVIQHDPADISLLPAFPEPAR